MFLGRIERGMYKCVNLYSRLRSIQASVSSSFRITLPQIAHSFNSWYSNTASGAYAGGGSGEPPFFSN